MVVPSVPGFLAAGAVMAEKFRRVDWSSSPLGSPSAWPQSLQTLVSFMLAAGQPMFIAWGPQRTLLYNDAYIPLLGRKHPTALGRPFFSVWGEAAREVSPLFDRVFDGAAIDIDDITLNVDRGQGLAEAHFAVSYTPIRADDGTTVGLFSICRETTASILEEQTADLQRRRLAQMFDNAPSFVAMLEGREHRVVLANARYRKLVGDRPLLGMTIAQALPDAVQQGYLALLDEVFLSGKPFNSTGAKYLVQPVSGGPITECFVDFVFQPVTDSTGQVNGIFVEGMDVTERVRAEASFRDSEARLREANSELERRVAQNTAQLVARETLIRTFYQHSSECHAILAEVREGIFRYEEINPATLRLYRMTREEVIGRTIDDIMDSETAKTLNAHLSACLRSNAPYHYERVQGDGIVEAVASPVPPESGMGRRVVVSARDVTARRRLESQLLQSQKMEAVGHLTGGIAHDFNNLLTGIIGSLELVESRVSQGRIHDLDRFVTAGQAAARRAAALTHRLLAFARRQTLDAKPTDVNRLVADMVDLIRRTVGPEIKVEVVGAMGLWSTLVDVNQLENALLNLCINARDAMPNGGKITIETANRWLDERLGRERELPHGQYISLCVSDTGCGMTPEVIARAFDPFFTTKPMGQGTGLGLSMIYGFARQSGGQARIYSEPGSGAMVCICLPRYHGSEAAGEAVTESASLPPSEHGKTVMVVDDESTVRMLVAEVLQDLGHSSIESADGVAALKILQSERRIDLLITDVGLPNGINGRQLADAARALRPELRVLFITGYAENAVFSHGHLDSSFEVLNKPFALDVLARRIALLISGS
jgi:PAS domain S-box-containing protein